VKPISLVSTTAVTLLAVTMFAGCSPETASMTVAPAPVVQPAPTPWPEPPQTEIPKFEEYPDPEMPVKPEYAKIPEQQFPWVYEDGGQRQMQAKPQVDILFVVDNSDSMRTAQENLVNNVSSFANAIGNNKMIDYHIGVVSVWDYSPEFKADDFGIGELRTVKDGHGKRFVTRNESAAILKSSLSIGVKALKDGGPQHEEIYAPLAAALDKSGNGAPNDGFFRREAQLVVIFLTDADEQPDTKIFPGGTRLSNEDMYDKLVSFKGGDKTKISAYGVLVPVNAPDDKKDYILRITPKDHPECFDFVPKKAPKLNGLCPKAFGPEKLENFVMKVNSAGGSAQPVRSTYIKSIISTSFGADLTAIGEGIKKKTLAKVIYLQSRPLALKYKPDIEVYYGTPEEVEAGKAQMIPYGGSKGWKYDVKQNAIVLSGDVDYKEKQNARYIVRMHVAALQ
jgi:hypothetical protein